MPLIFQPPAIKSQRLIHIGSKLAAPPKRDVVVLGEHDLLMRHDGVVTVAKRAVVKERVGFVAALTVAFDGLIGVVSLQSIACCGIYLD